MQSQKWWKSSWGEHSVSVTDVCNWEHPVFFSPCLQFWRTFGHATVSLSASNLIVKPQAVHTVPAAHIWTNTQRERDRHQPFSEVTEEWWARVKSINVTVGKYTVQSPTPVLIFVSGAHGQIPPPPTSHAAVWLQARAAVANRQSGFYSPQDLS